MGNHFVLLTGQLFIFIVQFMEDGPARFMYNIDCLGGFARNFHTLLTLEGEIYMMNVHASTRRSEQGFTLVELAIVMVIIGLLIGGILKGQELIANARIASTVTQIKSLDAALNTFQDKYNARAGLMTDAVARLPGCAAPCTDVAATATYGSISVAPAADTGAKAQLFLQLSAADLIAGIDGTGTSNLAFGKIFPAVKAGGGLWVGTASGPDDGIGDGTLLTNSTYALLTGQFVNPAATTGVLSASSAAQIDRKLDDGQPQAGSVQAGRGSCVDAATPPAYSEATGAGCVMAARVLN